MRTQRASRTPGDYIEIGVVIILLGLFASGLAAVMTETLELLWFNAASGLVGLIIMQVGVIAKGVSIGVRTATEGRSDRPIVERVRQ